MEVGVLLVLVLAFAQNVAFTMVSRSRNRDNMTYHSVCSVFSNALWFATMGYLVQSDFDYWLAVPYIIGTVGGSVTGAKVSMKIEKVIGAKT
jgi:uncharacterized membrane protein YfcA